MEKWEQWQNVEWISTRWPQHLPSWNCAVWLRNHAVPTTSLPKADAQSAAHDIRSFVWLAGVCICTMLCDSHALIDCVVWLVTWKNGCCYFARLNFNFLACGQIQTTFLIQVLVFFFLLVSFFDIVEVAFVELFYQWKCKRHSMHKPIRPENTRSHRKCQHVWPQNDLKIQRVFSLVFSLKSGAFSASTVHVSWCLLFQKCTWIWLWLWLRAMPTTIRGFDGFVVIILSDAALPIRHTMDHR